MSEQFDFRRFVDAQDTVIDAVFAELAVGRKQTDWMWFIFPPLAGVFESDAARRYAMSGLDEARAYLAHPLLGARLEKCCGLLLDTGDATAESMLGSDDALVLRACMTLFGQFHYEGIFDEVLAAYFEGLQHATTLELLAGAMQE
ncbi:DUF1810 domain-containing protein [Candidatus Marimicrobium litorale]|uniref:DUF1810 family protein n=1 Tax=Candidatus Marimicrobium litorale TaxID=2518991 RepID=A0ABT3T1R9_9GAMM|nr:DUF1810 family protein [Candidatus Marimicrobium litorale]MCX2976193.1 DUF1810 family protein [Candidatus Marimicrobium litorale]